MAAAFHSRPLLIASLCFIVALSAAAQVASPESDEGLLELNSGDFLRGTVQSLDNEGKLTWIHTLTGQEIRYKTEGIRQILYKRATKINEDSDVVWLNSDDRFVCRVQSITENEVVVVSSVFQQALRFKRSDVAGVTLRESMPHDDTILGGSMVATDWNVPGAGGQNDASKVTFKDGKMIIGGTFWPTISRDAEFPESFIIDTEIDWKDNLALRFEIGASKQDKNVARVSLAMELGADTIRMQRVMISDDGKRKSLSTLANIRDIDKLTDGARSFHLQAYINSLNGDCSIYINKKFAGKSDSPLINDALSGTHVLGSGIQINQKSPSPLRIRSFAINQWDGRSIPSQPRLHKADSDHIYFEDGDNTKGKVIGLERSGGERILTAEIPYTEKSPVSIPAAFLDYFTFSNNNESTPSSTSTSSTSSTISAHLTDGSILHLSRLKSGENSTLIGELIGGYKINLPSDAVTKLTFKGKETQENEAD